MTSQYSPEWPKQVKAETPRAAEVVQVIHTKALRGDGRVDCLREVDQYWAFDGTLLAEKDPQANEDKPAFIVTLPEGTTREDFERFQQHLRAGPDVSQAGDVGVELTEIAKLVRDKKWTINRARRAIGLPAYEGMTR